jgi:hypothetical protein
MMGDFEDVLSPAVCRLEVGGHRIVWPDGRIGAIARADLADRSNDNLMPY